MAPLKVGDKLPDGIVKGLDTKDISIKELTSGKKVIIFGVPGAFTPVCSSQHLPGYIQKYDELKTKGVDTIAMLTPNDPYVLKAWAEQYPDSQGKVLYLADGTLEYTKKLGFEVDLSGNGLGERVRRFSLLAEDGVIKELNLEESGGLTTSGADQMCTRLPMAGQ